MVVNDSNAMSAGKDRSPHLGTPAWRMYQRGQLCCYVGQMSPNPPAGLCGPSRNASCPAGLGQGPLVWPALWLLASPTTCTHLCCRADVLGITGASPSAPCTVAAWVSQVSCRKSSPCILLQDGAAHVPLQTGILAAVRSPCICPLANQHLGCCTFPLAFVPLQISIPLHGWTSSDNPLAFPLALCKRKLMTDFSQLAACFRLISHVVHSPGAP